MTVTAVGDRPRVWAGRLVWSGVSQAASSVTNFGLTALLAATSSSADLGRVSAVLAVYLLALALSRSLFSEPVVAIGSAHTRDSMALPRRVGAAGVVAVPVAFVVGVVVGLDRPVLGLLAVGLPGLLIQDAHRHLAWGRGRPDQAVALDGVWLVTSVSGLVGAVAVGDVGLEPATIVAAWVGGGLIAAVGGWLMTGAAAVPGSDTARPVQQRVAKRSALATSQSLAALSFNLAPLVLAMALRPELAGAAKAVLLPFTPILSLVAGLRLVTLPALARAAGPGRGAGPGAGPRPARARRRSPALAMAALAAAGAAPLAIALAVVAGRLAGDVEAIGDVRRQLPVAVALTVLYVVTQLLADGVALGPLAVRAVPLRLAAIGVEWLGLFAGAAVGGVDGLVWGWTIGLAVAGVIWLVPHLLTTR